MAGWCVQVAARGGVSGTCAPPPTTTHPYMETGTGWQLGESSDTTVVVTTPEVAEVVFDRGQRTRTVAMRSLPYGFRVAVLHTPHSSITATRRAGAMYAPRVREALSGTGTVLSTAPNYGDGIPFHDWGRHSGSRRGSCELAVGKSSDATAEWGQVGLSIHSYPATLVGPGFLTCADTEYYVPGRGLRAAVLLNAYDPAREPPANIQGLAPIPGLSGYYNSADAGGMQFGPLTATRQGNAWLIVAGGGRNAEEARIRLLQNLRATVHVD
jgi:hypothetical protein